jgi:hypothetical protein
LQLLMREWQQQRVRSSNWESCNQQRPDNRRKVQSLLSSAQAGYDAPV